MIAKDRLDAVVLTGRMHLFETFSEHHAFGYGGATSVLRVLGVLKQKPVDIMETYLRSCSIKT